MPVSVQEKYRRVAHRSLLHGSYGDAVLFSGSSEEQVRQTIAAVSKGPLPEELVLRINKV